MSQVCASITYQDVVKFFNRARNPEKGKPLMSWARIYKEGENYEVRMNDYRIGVFTPDNKFTFTMTNQQARHCSVTLSQALQRALPFVWKRVATGRYEVTSIADYDQSEHGYLWQYIRNREWYEVYDGLSFDLTTNQPINARPKITQLAVNQENKLEWLRKLRKFKQAVKIRARMGVLEALMQQVEKERQGINKYEWQAPDWSSDSWLDLLYVAVKNEECSTDMLKAFIKTASIGYWRNMVTIDDVLRAVDSVFTTHSIDLRKRFGVFDEVPDMQTEDEVSRHEMASA
jgi:hypothetical protein